jgi:hypothetical protein
MGGCLTLCVAFMFGSSWFIKEGIMSVFQPFFVVSSQTCTGVEAFSEMSAFYSGWSVSRTSIIDLVASVLNVPNHTDQCLSLSSLQRH